MIENFSDPFEEMGADIETGVKLFQSLKLGPAEFKDAQKFGRLKSIVEFLKEHPDPTFLIDTVTRSNQNPERSNLDHLWTYTELKKKEVEAKATIEKLKKELSYYGE